MIVYKGKRFISNSEYPDTDWVGDADYILNDNDEKDKSLERKIIGLYPNFKIVTDDNGDIVDVTETEPEPSPPVISLEQRVSAMEDATAEIIEMLMGGE